MCLSVETANCGWRCLTLALSRMSFRKFGRLFCWLIKPNPFHVATAGKINVPRYQSSEKQGKATTRGKANGENLTFLMCKSFVCVINMKHNVTKLQPKEESHRQIEGMQREREREKGGETS